MPKIMIIDDEPDIRELVKMIFNQKGHEVLTAENGKEGLKTLEEAEPDYPDLILLDINMPELNGWETLEELDKRDILENVPVVMFTVEELTFVKMLREDIEGLVGYIEKPFDRSEIIETAERVIDKNREINEARKKIRNSPKGEDSLAEAYKAWSRAKMIHERFLEKLKEMEDEIVEEKKLARVKNLKKGERNTIDQLERKKKELLRTVGLENLAKKSEE